MQYEYTSVGEQTTTVVIVRCSVYRVLKYKLKPINSGVWSL